MRSRTSQRLAVLFVFLFGLLFGHPVSADTLSCSVSTSCPSGVVIYRMTDTSNAHVELGGQTNYPQMVCCNGVSGLGNSCAGTFATALKLSDTSNAHAEENSQTNYAHNACISVPSGGTVSVGYQAGNCSGFDTTLGSINMPTNAHAGDTGAYATKICATASGVTPFLTFSISDNTIGFGTLTAGAVRYATGDTNGSASDAGDAHTISVATNAASGYTVTISGSTLLCSACGGATITPIGATATAGIAGTEQFGLRVILNSGTGAVSTPYNGSNWALDTGAFPDQIASGAGDGLSSQFGLQYIGNISANTETGSYTGVSTYTVTATF